MPRAAGRLAAAPGWYALIYARRGYGEPAPFGPESHTPAHPEEEARGIPAGLAACGISRAVLPGHPDGGTLGPCW